MLELELAHGKDAEQRHGRDERHGAERDIGRELTDREHERKDAKRKQHDRKRIERRFATFPNVTDELEASRRDDDAADERHDEDGTPAEKRAHEARDHGTEGRSQRDARSAQAQEEAELLARGAGDHHVHHEREQDARTHSLKDSARQQHGKRRRHQAEHLAHDEATARKEQELACGKPAREVGHRRREDRRHDHIARHEPLRRGGADGKRAHDVVQRDVDDVLVERGHERGDVHHRKKRHVTCACRASIRIAWMGTGAHVLPFFLRRYESPQAGRSRATSALDLHRHLFAENVVQQPLILPHGEQFVRQSPSSKAGTGQQPNTSCSSSSNRDVYGPRGYEAPCAPGCYAESHRDLISPRLLEQGLTRMGQNNLNRRNVPGRTYDSPENSSVATDEESQGEPKPASGRHTEQVGTKKGRHRPYGHAFPFE